MPKKPATNAVPSPHAIYGHPPDHPEYFVVRAQRVIGGQLIVDQGAVMFGTLEGARSWCRGLGLSCGGRLEGDDPLIVEVWT